MKGIITEVIELTSRENTTNGVTLSKITFTRLSDGTTKIVGVSENAEYPIITLELDREGRRAMLTALGMLKIS